MQCPFRGGTEACLPRGLKWGHREMGEEIIQNHIQTGSVAGHCVSPCWEWERIREGEREGEREIERERERELCGVCWPWSQSRAELNRALSRVGRQGCQGWGGWGAKVSSLWGILSPLIRSQGPPMADVSFTTGPSSSLFWQGGALCRLHCTNTKLFVQGGKKSLSFFPPFSFSFIYSSSLHVFVSG